MRFSRLAVNAIAFLVASAILSDLQSSRSVLVLAEDADSAPVEAPTTDEVAAEEEKEYTPPEGAEKFGFQAEVHRMLDIVVNSLYQHKDVFLRELISNASDALDKIRYLSLTQADKYKADEEIPLEVQIEYDDKLKTITIRDTGVGMTHDEMVSNLGTVARSGTTKFMEALKESGNPDATMSQIGQFGVGFYSTFLVAERVTVASKSPLDPVQHVWESSNGSGDFFIYEDPRGNTMKRGTEITLYLKEDESHYANAEKVKSLAKHYSEFVVHPISVRTEETMMVDDEDDDDIPEDVVDKKDDEDDLEVKDDDDEDDEEKPKKEKKKKEVTTFTWSVVNGEPALWTREKDAISDEEYQKFYKVLAGNENENAAEWSHFNAEGNVNFKSILYLPEELPAGYRQGTMDVAKGNLKLYVRKVLIGDDFDFLPKYLGFIKGVVDSDELTLNVNRETLQEEKTLKVIRKKVVKKAIDLIRQYAKESDAKEAKKEKKSKKSEDSEDDDDEDDESDEKKEEEDEKDSKKLTYIEWYKKFSPNIKLGIMEDMPNQKTLTKLLRYETSKSDGKLISLDKYVKNMKDWQKDIYVLGCVNKKECEGSPFLESFRDKDVEVIFLTDAIDEYMIKRIRDFDKMKIVQISSDNVKLGDEDEDLIKRREKVYSEKFKPLTKWLKKLYETNVMRVQVSKRSLGSVPAIVTSMQWGNSANMERIMKAQAYQYGVDPSEVNAMKVLEINPRHPIILKLLDGCPEDEDNDAPEDVTDAAWMIHDMAMLNGGFVIPNPEEHNKRLAKVLQAQFALDSLTLEPEINPPVEEDVPPEGKDDDDDDDDEDGPDLMDMNNIDVGALRDKFPDAGWPDKEEKEKKAASFEEEL